MRMAKALLIINFIDFKKAFALLHIASLWGIVKSYGIPEKLIRIIRLFSQGTECAVLDNGQTSHWFKFKTGVKQACVMSGFLSLFATDWVMRQTTEKANTRIRWKMMEKLEDLDFVDDIALISTKTNQMHRKITKLLDTASTIRLRISRKRTKVLRVNSDGEEIKEVNDPGATVSNEGGTDMDMQNRLGKG